MASNDENERLEKVRIMAFNEERGNPQDDLPNYVRINLACEIDIDHINGEFVMEDQNIISKRIGLIIGIHSYVVTNTGWEDLSAHVAWELYLMMAKAGFSDHHTYRIKFDRLFYCKIQRGFQAEKNLVLKATTTLVTTDGIFTLQYKVEFNFLPGQLFGPNFSDPFLGRNTDFLLQVQKILDEQDKYVVRGQKIEVDMLKLSSTVAFHVPDNNHIESDNILC